MYEIAKKSREAMKSKARRLAGEKDSKVDSSNWTPAEPLDTAKKTGLQPTTPRKFKSGGKVIEKMDGDKAPCRADRKPRKCGGRVKKEVGGSLPSPEEAVSSEARMKNVKVEDTRKLPPPKEAAASAARTGDAPARKYGGRTKKKAEGGFLENLGNALAGEGYIDGSTWKKVDAEPTGSTAAAEKPAAASKARSVARPSMGSRPRMDSISPAQAKRELKMGRDNMGDTLSSEQAERELEMGRKNVGIGRMISSSDADLPGAKKGGKIVKRAARKSGGRAKGKTNISINILAGGKPGPMPPMPAPEAAGAIPMPAPAPAPAAPPPMPMPPPGQMPMGRKAGGRVASFKDMTAGAGSGEGRQQKTSIQQKKRRA